MTAVEWARPANPLPKPTVNAPVIARSFCQKGGSRRGALRVVRAWILSIVCVAGLAGFAAAQTAPRPAITPLPASVAPPVAAAPAGRVTSIRFAGDAQRTRIAVSSDKPLTYRVFSLDSGQQRIVIELPRVRWSIGGLTAEAGTGQGSGLVASFRYSHNTASTSRLVLDLAAPATMSRDFALTPTAEEPTHRIVIDLERASAADFAAASRAETERARAAPQRAARKPLVVIDAGHGGRDPGASSPEGLREKDVTLAAALALRDELVRSRRYDVALTRSTDVFIELDQRVERARALGADLFISLHADAGGRSEVRGASVYTLSPEGERRAESERHRNDWVMAVEADQTRPAEVNQILADLVTRETKNQSTRFAHALVPALEQAGWPVLPSTHRQRGFYVLLSPDVPAVLLEMGFMTNAQDASALTSESKRRQLVRGIAGAIDGFFDSESRLLAQR
jgi:N-acetylmuramoyl-L-alanine amidase